MTFKSCLQASLRIFPGPRASTGSKGSEFFQVPELIWRIQLKEWHLANGLYSKEEEAWNFSKSQSLYREGDVGIFYKSQSLGGIWGLKFFTSQGLYRRGEEVFQVLVHLYKEKTIYYDDSYRALLGASFYWVPDPIHVVKLRIFPSQSLYGERAQNFSKFQEYEEIWRK